MGKAPSRLFLSSTAQPGVVVSATPSFRSALSILALQSILQTVQQPHWDTLTLENKGALD